MIKYQIPSWIVLQILSELDLGKKGMSVLPDLVTERGRQWAAGRTLLRHPPREMPW